MTCCDHCLDSESFFDRRAARRDLRRYRRRGARPSTRLLIDRLRPDAPGATLLDIGGGVGAIQHELFMLGLRRATHVDASSAYLDRSGEEAARRGHRDRVTYRHADFVAAAEEITAADLVTLDRVICCYPDVEALVGRSLRKAKRAYGLVYPRNRWFVRLALRLGNAYLRLTGSAFRTYLHSPERVESLAREAGFTRSYSGKTVLWRVEVYRPAP